MENTRLRELLQQHITGNLSEEDSWEMYALIMQPGTKNELSLALADLMEYNAKALIIEEDPEWKDRVAQIVHIDSVGENLRLNPRIHFIKKSWFRYAAAIVILVFGISTYIFYKKENKTEVVQATLPSPIDQVLPGSDQAVLTLADGQKIQLDSSAKEWLEEKGITNENAEIAYYGKGTGSTINTLTTPKGGQYKIRLSDGTIVWLNAASSLTYPTTFEGARRAVSVTGEAFFEVAKDINKPFVVSYDRVMVEVLGTSFNTNAYTDEVTKITTVTEGAVRVRYQQENILLNPGQQAEWSPDQFRRMDNADLEKAMAWKNGMFNFQGVRVAELMRQLSRWYNIDVIYEKQIPDIRFVGEMSRKVPLADVLQGLQGMGLHFRMEPGRRLIILP